MKVFHGRVSFFYRQKFLDNYALSLIGDRQTHAFPVEVGIKPVAFIGHSFGLFLVPFAFVPLVVGTRTSRLLRKFG
jgi:hypothetical protein